MDPKYFKALTSELYALKDRVRNFIHGQHWLTDGEWKESVLRTFLRRNMPRNVEVGRGFIIADNETSTQIDVLICDSSKPILFRDGDLMFTTADAVLGVIEVKTSLDISGFKGALNKLCSINQIIINHTASRVIFGLFAFEDGTTDIDSLLSILQEEVQGQNRVHLVNLGRSKFIRFWQTDPQDSRKPNYKWHAYQLENKAPAYFLHNVVKEISPVSVTQNKTLWFPEGTKENRKIGEIELMRKG